jgi:antitoxin component YwqK of YwqJK toxin-antitoxin module
MYKLIVLFITLNLFGFKSFSQNEINPNGYNVFHYSNGEKSSEGNFLNGKPEGYWKNYYETGVLKSEGNRTNHELDSIWIFYYPNGLLKEKVSYLNSKRNGATLIYSEEGFLLEKRFLKNDTIQGFSYSYFNDLTRVEYERPYQDGMLEGRGFQFARDGRIIGLIKYEKGVFKSVQKINSYNSKNKKVGLWITYYEDIKTRKAKLLEGRYKNDLKNGYFREYDKKGVQLSTTKYVNGQVVENAEELMSVDLIREYYPDASVKWEKTYLGTLSHGIWKEYDTAGIVISTVIYNLGIKLGEGIMDSEGIKQGSWKEYYKDGNLRAEGDYNDGSRIGAWKFFHPNGKLEQKGKYRKGGKANGLWVWYYDNSAVRREENYINGKEDGELIEYDLEGNIISQGEYIEGLKEGEWTINTGDYIEKGNYIEGMMHGLWEGTYKSTDKTAFKGEYLEDEPNDKHTYYYPSGRKMLEGKYQMGLKVGDWKRYDENGVLRLTIEYKNGVAKKLSGKTVIGNTED